MVEPTEVSCRACLVIDDSGRVLWAREAGVRLPNASTTKMATALLVRSAASLEETVTVSATAAATGGGGLDLGPGDVYTVEALLKAMLMTSSNDAAVALAEHVGPTLEAFMTRLDRLVRGLGAKDTSFVNPHGLDAPGHYSTAKDLATIGEALLADDVLADIVATSDDSIAGPGGTELLENRNPLLETFLGAIGIKTGQTLGAGTVLVAAATRGPRTIITVAMNSLDVAADTTRMLEYGFAAARVQDRLADRVLVRAGETVAELLVDAAGTIPVIATEDIDGSDLSFRTAATERFTVEVRATEGLAAPISTGDVVGEIEVTDAGGGSVIIDAIAGASLAVEEDPWLVGALAAVLEAAALVAPGA